MISLYKKAQWVKICWIIFIIFFFLLTGCQIKTPQITITVIGIDWSNSLYCFNEEKERERICALVKNIVEAKKKSGIENFLIKTVEGRLRGIPLNTIIIIPIASDEVSFREKIRCSTPEKLDTHINENAILPDKKSYTFKTDFCDFFNLAKNEVEKQLEILKNRYSTIKKGEVKVKVDFILITDGIHDPKGRINIPKVIENINVNIIKQAYPDFSIEKFADSISLPENSKIFFVGVPPRLKFDFWQKVMDKKGVACIFFEYADLNDTSDIRKKIY
ncbi:MAG: hypothetical protein NC833_04600 [Candidatus Omnitrophica bacterium]|nr:hypothetical protein [Candidatus Omnitrophota bacterium]